jgi:hypothetical protein
MTSGLARTRHDECVHEKTVGVVKTFVLIYPLHGGMAQDTCTRTNAIPYRNILKQYIGLVRPWRKPEKAGQALTIRKCVVLHRFEPIPLKISHSACRTGDTVHRWQASSLPSSQTKDNMTDPRNVAHDKKVQQEKKHNGEEIAPGAEHTPQPGKKPHLAEVAEEGDDKTESGDKS